MIKKNISVFIALLLMALAPIASYAASTHSHTHKQPTQEEINSYLTLYGWYVGKESGISEIGLSDKEMAQLYEGFAMAAKNEAPPSGSYDLATDMQVFLQERVNAHQKEKEAQMAIESENNVKQGQDYFAKLSKKPEIEKTNSGLFYEIKEKGKGNQPETGNKVVVHYEGKLIDGTIFDSSKKRGEPATFPVDGVIPGFREGLMLLSEGGKATLYIPAELGYGNANIPGIPAGSTLVFDIELIKVL